MSREIPVSLWIVILILSLGLFLVVLYQLLSIAELTADYINTRDLAKQLNPVMKAEYAMQAVLSLLLAFEQSYIHALVYAIITAYHFYKYTKGLHLIDPATAFSTSDRLRKESYAKAAIYAILFFHTLYRCVKIPRHFMMT
eukprot:TRINITY_DN3297_c0_g1_i4.p1 TRINITY_DN3297_c0_g1~~TRINITY_DN3297_c0_g1_i4.p1  ORF type:complete len:141 (-),score=23.67 TRINITY_DN3297_c0_g1_i4:437-859(-)